MLGVVPNNRLTKREMALDIAAKSYIGAPYVTIDQLVHLLTNKKRMARLDLRFGRSRELKKIKVVNKVPKGYHFFSDSPIVKNRTFNVNFDRAKGLAQSASDLNPVIVKGKENYKIYIKKKF